MMDEIGNHAACSSSHTLKEQKGQLFLADELQLASESGTRQRRAMPFHAPNQHEVKTWPLKANKLNH
jgi:hypothetical protein